MLSSVLLIRLTSDNVIGLLRFRISETDNSSGHADPARQAFNDKVFV
jgi:hypothetical protein